MINIIKNILKMLVIEMVLINTHYGLKSIIYSLSITPDLRPGLFSDLMTRASAQNSSLFMTLKTHIIIKYIIGS
jgi:hypothetical protein